MMDKELARNFEKTLGDAFGLLDYACFLASMYMDEAQLKAFKRDIGLFMGRSNDVYMEPIYNQFPDLKPAGKL